MTSALGEARLYTETLELLKHDLYCVTCEQQCAVESQSIFFQLKNTIKIVIVQYCVPFVRACPAATEL